MPQRFHEAVFNMRQSLVHSSAVKNWPAARHFCLFMTSALVLFTVTSVRAGSHSLLSNESYQLAVANLTHGNCAQAVMILDPLANQLGSDPDFWLTFGRAHECTQDYEGALRGYRIAAAAHPENTVLEKKIGELLYSKQQQEQQRAQQKAQQQAEQQQAAANARAAEHGSAVFACNLQREAKYSQCLANAQAYIDAHCHMPDNPIPNDFNAYHDCFDTYRSKYEEEKCDPIYVPQPPICPSNPGYQWPDP